MFNEIEDSIKFTFRNIESDGHIEHFKHIFHEEKPFNGRKKKKNSIHRLLIVAMLNDKNICYSCSLNMPLIVDDLIRVMIAVINESLFVFHSNLNYVNICSCI